MSAQEGGRPPARGSFDKATVDRWQVFGGMAGVAALLLSVVGGIKDLIPLSLVAAGAVTLLGVVLLFRWRRPPRTRPPWLFALPVLVTVGGAVATGVFGTLELRAGAEETPAHTGTTSADHRVDIGVELGEGFSIDLDSTDEDGGVSTGPAADVDLSFASDGLSGDHLVVVSGSQGHKGCAAAKSRVDRLSRDLVRPGAILCALTSEGRWARVTVVSADQDSVEFDLVVWAK
jgi:hypothetical protein